MFTVTVEVTKTYEIKIEAKTKKEALRQANIMKSTIIAEQGFLTDVTTRATEIEEQL